MEPNSEFQFPRSEIRVRNPSSDLQISTQQIHLQTKIAKKGSQTFYFGSFCLRLVPTQAPNWKRSAQSFRSWKSATGSVSNFLRISSRDTVVGNCHLPLRIKMLRCFSQSQFPMIQAVIHVALNSIFAAAIYFSEALPTKSHIWSIRNLIFIPFDPSVIYKKSPRKILWWSWSSAWDSRPNHDLQKMTPTSFAKQKWEGRTPQFYFWVFCLTAIEITRSWICTNFYSCEMWYKKTRSLTFRLLVFRSSISSVTRTSSQTFCLCFCDSTLLCCNKSARFCFVWGTLLYNNIIKSLAIYFSFCCPWFPRWSNSRLTMSSRTPTVYFPRARSFIFPTHSRIPPASPDIISQRSFLLRMLSPIFPGLFCTFDAISFGRNHFYSCAQRYSYSSAQPCFLVYSSECCPRDSYFATFFSECSLA